MKTDGMILTNAGRGLLARAVAGEALHFTKGFLGDGKLPDSADPRTLTALISPVKQLPIAAVNASKTGVCEITFSITNQNQAKGFWLRETGIYAHDPDGGPDILYAYCNKGDEAGYLEGSNGIDFIDYSLTLACIIDQAEHVTASITTVNNYVTPQKMEERIRALYGNSSDIAGVWAYGKDSAERLSPHSWADFKKAVLGNADIDSVNSRLEHLEDNTARILMALAGKDIMPDFSHFIIDDFSQASQADAFSCSVTSAVAGDDSLDCEPLEGLLQGGIYTLTDGSLSEEVQVHSVSIENGIKRVILKKEIANTYNLENARLYRTSASVSTGGASGKNGQRLYTIARNWYKPLRNARLYLRSDSSSAADFRCWLCFRDYPGTVKGELLGTGTGGRKTYQLAHPEGVSFSSIRIYYSGSAQSEGWDCNTEVGRITCTAPAGAAVTCDYEYGWPQEQWRELKHSESYGLKDCHEHVYRYSMPAGDASKSTVLLRIDFPSKTARRIIQAAAVLSD